MAEFVFTLRDLRKVVGTDRIILDGVTLSIDEGLMIGGVPFIRVYGCKPHDCGDEQVSLIFSTDGKIGAIKVRSVELTGGKPTFFGSDNPQLRRIVDRDF